MPAPWVITIDRTDWYLGETPLNVLVLGIAHRGVAFPLLWRVLPKKGCSDTRERIELVEEFVALFGRASIRYLCADREFVSLGWFAYLRRERLAFRLRVRANTRITNGRGQSVQARHLFRSQRIGRAVLLKGARRLLGQELFVAGLRRADGEYVIVAAPDESEALLEDYARRWEIETLFGCLKTRGFCLEATHVTDTERLRKLVALLALAFCWAHLAGEWLAHAGAVADQEAWATGEEYLPAWLRSSAAHTMQPSEHRSTACVPTSYSTFVPYIDTIAVHEQ